LTFQGYQQSSVDGSDPWCDQEYDVSEKVTPGVLVIYTGGTIGSRPRDPDPDSPQIVVPWEEFLSHTPEVGRLPFEVDASEEIPPLDSCNVGPSEWSKMAEIIFANYDEYAGFVILHGTDTMVYTASALSFMLRDLAKPVIITGAQRSAMVSTRNDATQNFLTALEIANPAVSRLPVVPEVCIFFGGKLLRGNRAIKIDTSGYEAYETPNIPPLGLAGDRIVINEKIVRPLPDRGRKFSIRTRLDTGVMPIYVSPGIQDTSIAEAQLDTAGLRAAVVLSFGSGNIPTKPEFLEVFRAAREGGVILANVSQCPRGPVEQGIYETSAQLVEAGFVSGNDITIEAAQCKLMVLLGDPDADVEDAELAFQQNLAGEQSTSMFVTKYGKSNGTLDDESPRLRIRGVGVEGRWSPNHVERALVRLHGATITAPPVSDSAREREALKVKKDAPAAPASLETVAFRVFLNLDDSVAQPDLNDPGYAGEFRKWPAASTGLSVFDISSAFRSTVSAGERVSFTIILDTPGATLAWDDADIAVFAKEFDV
jgi:L-asparaginase